MYGESDNVDLSIHREIDRIVLRSSSYSDRKIIKVSLLFIIFSEFKCKFMYKGIIWYISYIL